MQNVKATFQFLKCILSGLAELEGKFLKREVGKGSLIKTPSKHPCDTHSFPHPITRSCPHRTSAAEGPQLRATNGGLKETPRREPGHRARKAPGEGRRSLQGAHSTGENQDPEDNFIQRRTEAGGRGVGLGRVQRGG